MIAAGKLSRRITLERATETISPGGSVTKTWHVLASVRAQLVEQSTVEAVEAYGEAETGTLIFRVRWIPNVEITTQDRVTFDGDGYDLKGVREIGEKRGLELRIMRRAA